MVPVVSCDPNFADVELLLHFDYFGVPTTFDSSSYNHSVTIPGTYGGLSTVAYEFGNSSLNVYGANSFNTYVCGVPLTLGSPLDIFTQNAWTIEGWTRVDQNNSGLNAYLFDYGANDTTPINSDFSMFWTANGGDSYTLTVADANMFGGSTTLSETVTMTPGTWHHFALVLNAGVVTAYLDGVAFGTTTTLWNPTTYDNQNAGTYVLIGSFPRGNTSQLISYIDEFRVSSIARYTANFTPPTAAFPDIACPTTVPNVVGLPLATAEAEIITAGFTVGTVTAVNNLAPPGTVIGYSPTSALAGDPINLTVSAVGVTPNFLNDEAMFGGYVGGVLNLVEFTYLPERTPFLEGATNLIINRYKQEPNDTRQRGVDYTFFLVPGETIQTVSIVGISAQGVLQANTNPVVTPLVVSGLIIDPAGAKFAYTVSGGEDGIEYTVQFETTTQIQSSNVEEIFSINILIEDSFP